PIAMSLTADPVFTNITFAANRSNGIRVLEGTLSSNARLRKRDVAGYNNIAYIVEYLTIGQNAVLTIDPGVVIKLPAGWYYRSITVDGALVANGTFVQRIIFTSLNDDSNGGDTNNDGNASSPAKGDWWALMFSTTSNDTINALRNCDFRYGGAPPYGDPTLKNYGMVQLHSARVIVDSCYFQQSSTSALAIFGSADPSVTNCQISNVTLTPIMMSMFAEPTFSNNLALNVGYMALGIVPETYAVNATVPKRDFGGYTNITYLLMEGWYGYMPTVNSGTTLTIPEGVVFKHYPVNTGSPVLTVNGALIVNGTAAEPVIFTDPRDDSAGNPGDTNGDGFATEPQINNSSMIHFGDVSMDSLSVLRYVETRYQNVGISLQQASPSIVHGRFARNNWGVRLNGVSTPAVDSCAFDNLEYAPLYISLVSYPRSSEANTISGSTFRAIGIVNETLAQDVTLTRRTFAGIQNIPYVLHEYTVGTGAVLTVQPGVIAKFLPYGWLTVRKGLIAEGGAHPDSTIVFTDIRDDFYGGDTNADSSATAPADPYYYEYWQGLRFEDESLDPLCRLSHVVVQHAGYYWNDEVAGIQTTSASPSILYSTIANNKIGIRVLGSSNPVINYSDISGNRLFGLNYPAPAFTLDARWNWWGSDTGPTHSDNAGGTGDKVSNSVNYTPFLTSGSANPVAGDVSLNGLVQAFDASLILKYVVQPHGSDSLNALQKRAADVNGNGGLDTVAITAYDASLILQYVVGLVNSFPIEVNRRELPGTSEPRKSRQIPVAFGTAVASGQSYTLP
ncbi:MAG: dockerin type I domain-containing protein, partial [Bacteroidota bacterium]